MDDWTQKSDKTLHLDSISIPILNSAGATHIRDMVGVIAKLQQISCKFNRYEEEASIHLLRSGCVTEY